MILGIDFPPITHVTRWPDIWFADTPFAINKTVLIFIASVLITLVFFFVAGRKRQLVPTGVQIGTPPEAASTPVPIARRANVAAADP